MTISGPLFKVFGSKWQASKHLPPPEYDRIVEPFAGGAGYSLRHSDHNVFLCERNDNVRDLWRWLIEAKPDEILDVPINVPVGTDIRELGLASGQALLLKNWQRTNNCGSCWTISKWGHLPGQWTANTRARVAEESQAIKHWEVIGPWYETAFAKFDYDGCPVTWLIDPPYSGNYQYGMPPINYYDLASDCLSAKGQVIVCEAMDPKTGNVPNWLPFEPWQSRVTSRRVSGSRSAEMLCVLNGAPDTVREVTQCL